jgi:hypothetical protein
LIIARIPEWYSMGVRVIGGCCRVSPLHLGRIANACNALNIRRRKQHKKKKEISEFGEEGTYQTLLNGI